MKRIKSVGDMGINDGSEILCANECHGYFYTLDAILNSTLTICLQ